MLFHINESLRSDIDAVAADEHYDAVIIGSGIAGAIIAGELCSAGKRVLVVEAAAEIDRTLAGYQNYLNHFYAAGEKDNQYYLNHFYAAASKDNQSPFPVNPNAEMPRGGDCRKLQPGETNGASYMVQSGPYVTDTVYSRVFGGTTIHWEGKVPRMLPDDFRTRTEFGRGVDWPLSYDDLEKDYRAAEFEIGVSADVSAQTYLGVWFPKNYVFPMHGLPLSYLDQVVARGIDGTEVELDGRKYPIKVRPFPQARNAIPNSAYDGDKGYIPIGAVSTHQVELGGRCQGNTSCVPICPVQAKYHSGKTLAKAMQTGRVELIVKSVASRVVVDPDSGRVSAIELKVYRHECSGEHDVVRVKAKIFVLAAHAIEIPRLMLASGLPSSSGLVGRNLMDHAYLLNWALMPVICGTMRGSSCTGGVIDLRNGPFRRHQAAFSIDIHNDGWGWATGSPFSDLVELVDSHNRFGPELRQALIDRVSRQLLFAFMIDVLPEESNRVSVDPRYTDPLGNMRPIVSFTVPEYTLRGAAYAREFSRTVFARLGAVDYTSYDPADYGFVTYNGQGYAIRGGNHLAGTHVMGLDKSRSVVNTDQRSWDHENLYLVGTGSMPSIGTANVTLTMAALCYRSARAMLKQLH